MELSWTKVMSTVWVCDEFPEYNIERHGHGFQVWWTYDSTTGKRASRKLGAYSTLAEAQGLVTETVEFSLEGNEVMTKQQYRPDMTAEEVDSIQADLPTHEVRYIEAAMREAESCETAADLHANLTEALTHAQTLVEELEAALAEMK